MLHLLDRRELLAASGAALLGGAGLERLAGGRMFSGKRPWTHAPIADEIPWMNLPREMREWNWGGGSCVHASTVMCFRWQGDLDRAAMWRRTYSGGESSYGLRRKLDHHGIAYHYTDQAGDDRVLEYGSRTRRGAVIFYYPNHSICFAGYARRGGNEYAVLLDNNRIDEFIWVPKADFLRHWRGYGGFALVLLGSPAPRQPYYPFTPARGSLPANAQFGDL